MFEAVNDAALRLDLQEALERLPLRQRQAAELWFAGYTQAEIAETLGIGRRSAGGLVERARRNLKEFCR